MSLTTRIFAHLNSLLLHLLTSTITSPVVIDYYCDSTITTTVIITTFHVVSLLSLHLKWEKIRRIRRRSRAPETGVPLRVAILASVRFLNRLSRRPLLPNDVILQLSTGVLKKPLRRRHLRLLRLLRRRVLSVRPSNAPQGGQAATRLVFLCSRLTGRAVSLIHCILTMKLRN